MAAKRGPRKPAPLRTIGGTVLASCHVSKIVKGRVLVLHSYEVWLSTGHEMIDWYRRAIAWVEAGNRGAE